MCLRYVNKLDYGIILLNICEVIYFVVINVILIWYKDSVYCSRYVYDILNMIFWDRIIYRFYL